MSVPLAAGQISNTARLESEMQTDFELLVSLLKEGLGGSAKATGASYQLTSNTFTVADNLYAYQIDTNGGSAATDTLNKITPTASTRDGMVIMIQPTVSTRVITVANAVGGTGQILTKDGNNKIFRDARQWMMLMWSAGAGAWSVIFDDETFRVNQLIGGANATTLTNTGTAGNITPTAAIHQVNTSVSGTQTIANALTTSITDLGRCVIFTAANAPTNIPQFIHMNGGAGQFQMSDSANLSLATPQMAVMFQLKSVTSVLTWVEVLRVGTVPAPTAKGQSLIATAAGIWALDSPTATNGLTEIVDSTSANGRSWQANDPGLPGGRLTGFSGKPVSLGGGTGTPIYYTPYRSQYVPLWDVSRSCFIPFKFSEINLPVTALTASTGYWLYVYNNAGTLTLEAIAVSGSAPTIQNGVLAKPSAPDHLFVGSVYLDATKSFTQGGASGALTLRNHYNKVPITVSSNQTGTGTWTYASATVRVFSASASGLNIINHGLGSIQAEPCFARLYSIWKTSVSADTPILGIGMNSTTAISGLTSQTAGSLIAPTVALALTTTNYFTEVVYDASSGGAGGLANLSPGLVTFYPLESMPAGTLTQYGTDFTTGTAPGIQVDTDF